VGQHTAPKGNIIRDDRIKLTGVKPSEDYPDEMRLVEADIELDGKSVRIIFITNNFEWSPQSIADLYRARWGIEVFFKEMKRTLQLCDFLGHNKNAILWQVWTALTLYVLLRFLAFVHGWGHGFKRFFCLLRSSVWDCFNLSSLVSLRGTAGGVPALRAAPEQLYLPGFGPPG